MGREENLSDCFPQIADSLEDFALPTRRGKDAEVSAMRSHERLEVSLIGRENIEAVVPLGESDA